MNVIVTGGAGFIGSHIVDRLVDDGHKVLVIDDLSADSHEQFYFNQNAEYSYYSVSDYYNILHHFEGIDLVFHLAAESRIQPCIQNPVMATLTNVVGTCSVLQAAKETGVKRVMYSSTSAAYGVAHPIPLKEDMANDCLNAYSVTKVSGEELCKMFYRLYGLETVAFRYFNVYGDRQPTSGQYAPVVGLFQKQFDEGLPFTVIGDGLQSRDFTHVSDVVEANMKAAFTEDKRAFAEVFNVGAGKNHTVMDLIKMIGGEDAFHIAMPERPGEARHSKADTSKAKEILKWEAKVSLEDWLK
jgi:UDP-glucose 4-epimerase|tara:strand:- start:326 stop:1222 length:897 start_codon:yes stop_codon:yes gene_type:complete